MLVSMNNDVIDMTTNIIFQTNTKTNTNHDAERPDKPRPSTHHVGYQKQTRIKLIRRYRFSNVIGLKKTRHAGCDVIWGDLFGCYKHKHVYDLSSGIWVWWSSWTKHVWFSINANIYQTDEDWGFLRRHFPLKEGGGEFFKICFSYIIIQRSLQEFLTRRPSPCREGEEPICNM